MLTRRFKERSVGGGACPDLKLAVPTLIFTAGKKFCLQFKPNEKAFVPT